MKLLLLKTLAFVTMFLTFASCNDLQKDEEPEGITPVTASEEVSSFFKRYLTGNSFGRTGFNLGEKTECFVINNIDEFKDVAPPAAELPSIDFDKYTLVIGQVEKECPRYILSKQYIETEYNKTIINIVFKTMKGGVYPDMLVFYYFWGLYDKLPDSEISLNIIDK